ncbi:MAG: flagellar biosynthesis protein FlhB [Candidatus Eisenbacteria bacterium]
MSESKHERTEKPSHRKQQKARRKGQVVRSNELKSAVMILAGAMVLKFSGPWMKEEMLRKFAWAIEESARTPVTAETAPGIIEAWIRWAGVLLSPTFLVLGAVGIAVNLFISGGLVISSQGIAFNPGKLNPITGAGRLLSGKVFFKLAVDGVKLVLIGLVCFHALKGAVPVLLEHVDVGLDYVFSNASGFALSILVKASLVLLLLGIVDFAYQRRSHTKDLMMSKREVKDEYKETEGDPIIKGRIRSAQRDLARRRMMQAVPEATVVLTNPTEIAVALKYDPDDMDAPRVVAKGKRLLAQRIRRIAEENGIPVVENKPLARSIYKLVEVGGEIPGHLYRAVAEVLSYVYRLRGRTSPLG